ncbi:hypothetical protein R9X47_17685 [Wukongibacter baidiensis]
MLKEKEEFREDLVSHVSPLAWEDINFVGEYKFNNNEFYSLENLRGIGI